MTGPSPEERRFRHQRRALVLDNADVRGLDFVEPSALPGLGGAVWTLTLRFISAPPSLLTRDQVRILTPDGAVDHGLRVVALRPVFVGRDGGAAVVEVQVSDPERAAALRHDPSVYLVELDHPQVDRFFRVAGFRFDGALAGAEPPTPLPTDLTPPGPIDYLAKDYESFRRLMLDRMAVHVPDWRERNPADLGVAVVEVLAYAADYLSYYQDAVATEAYLDTARRRTSVRRHLRLLGHVLHEGCNARVWVHVEVADRAHDADAADHVTLPAGTRLLTRAGDLPTLLLEDSERHRAARAQGSLTFETMHDAVLRRSHNRLPVYTWGTTDYTIPRGATAVTLEGHHSWLRPGDVLVLEQETTGATASSAPGRVGSGPCHVVRVRGVWASGSDPVSGADITEVRFHDDDALSDALGARPGDGSPREGGVLVARGNVVLADHGETRRYELPVVGAGRYAPELPDTDLTWTEPQDVRPASARALTQAPERAVPSIRLFEIPGHAGADDPRAVASDVWEARPDLLESPPYAPDFVAETERDGRVTLRFGDGRQGRRPTPGARFVAQYRVGTGPRGQLGRDALGHLVSSQAGLAVAAVRNPLPAWGGEEPESMEQARLVTARRAREPESCVTATEVERLATRQPGVLATVVEPRWTGSWETFFLFVQRPGGRSVDPEFERCLRRAIEPSLLAGADLEVRDARLVPADVSLRVRLDDGAVREIVDAALRDRLSDQDDARGSRGYFHPDNFTFGQPLHLGSVLDAVLAVAGVMSVEAERFRLWGPRAGTSDVTPQIEPGRLGIVSVRSRPGQPHLGRLALSLEGGS